MKLLLILSCLFVVTAFVKLNTARASVYETDFISAPGSFPSLHSATLAEIPSQKKILGCWYAGSKEGAQDVQIYCSTSDLDSANWSKPSVAVAAQEVQTGDMLSSKTVGNPVLFHDVDTKVTYLFFGTVTIGGWRGVKTFYRISRDFGKTWSASIPVNGSFPGESGMLGRTGKFVRIKPLQISKDELLVPLHTEWDDKRSIPCLFKKVDGIFKESSCQVIPGSLSLQPSFVLFNQEVLAYTRSRTGFVQFSKMDRNTYQWSALENLAVGNPDSSLDTIVTSDQKKILLIGNTGPQGRASLDLLVSTDGKAFKKVYSFDQAQDGSEYSYPAVIQTSDGFYQLAYTYLRQAIKHVRFSDAWLEEQISKAQ